MRRAQVADLRQVPAHAHAVPVEQPPARDHGRGDPHRGLARAAAPAATRIADAVLVPVGVIGMPRPELIGDARVVLAARVGVADQQRDRRAGGLALVHAGKNLDLVRFMPLRGMPTAPGRTALQVVAELGSLDRQAGRAPVDHATDRRPVAFAKRGDGEELAERIAGHEGMDVRMKVPPA